MKDHVKLSPFNGWLAHEFTGRLTISVEEVAQLLSTSPEVVTRLIDSRRLRAITLDPDAPPVVRPEDVLGFLESATSDADS